LVHPNDLEEEIYEADPSLVEEYEEEEEKFPIEDLELVESIDIQVEAFLELIDPDHTQIVVNPELDDPDHTQATMEEQLEETLEEDPIVEPNPEFPEQEEFIEDLAYLTQYPLDKVTFLLLIKDLFPEISDPFFH